MEKSGSSFTDQALISGFIENDQKCVEQIYNENYKGVLRYILKNNGNEDDAKDVYQETFIAVWLNVKDGKFKAKTGKSIGGYIYQIARFKWLDKLKSKENKSTVRLVHNRFSKNIESEYDFENEAKIKRMEKLYDLLDERCKTILNLYYYKKKSLAEIGKQLNYEAATLKTLKYRCMKKLRQLHLENPLTNDDE